MQEFRSVFYKKNNLIRFTLLMYILCFFMGAFMLFIQPFSIWLLLLVLFTLVMITRALYFMFEKLLVDTRQGTITLKILKKRFEISRLRVIIKVRPGQVRLVDDEGNLFPVSIEKEDEFISLLQKMNERIRVE